jgi:ribonucleoside-diphosphate reductase alpha chain
MRKPTGDQNLRCLNLHHGINISDRFMEIIERSRQDFDTDDSWNLIDPHSGEVRDTVSARHLWQRILELRMETGEPYLHFIDTSNAAMPEFQKEKGLKIHQSNLCSEIILPTNKERTAVCCLSSVNLEYFDAWNKNELFLRDVAEMLDNVLQYFIDNAPEAIGRAVFSAKQERSIGVGALGFHAYLQKKNLPFECAMAKVTNNRMFKLIRDGLDKASLELGSERGEAPDATGTGKRFSHVMAIAPNASSSIIMGNTSPSIEPYRANAYRQDTLSGAFTNRNKYLSALLEKKIEQQETKMSIDEIWSNEAKPSKSGDTEEEDGGFEVVDKAEEEISFVSGSADDEKYETKQSSITEAAPQQNLPNAAVNKLADSLNVDLENLNDSTEDTSGGTSYEFVPEVNEDNEEMDELEAEIAAALGD